MRLLLDTHVLLWWLADDPGLAARQRVLIAAPENTVYVSSVSVAEISIKASLGKLDAPPGIVEAATTSGFDLLSFSAAHAEQLRDLPWHHRDPFDRMLVAQALTENLVLVSSDRQLPAYDIDVR